MSFVVVSLGFHLTSHCCSKLSDFLLALHIKQALNGRYIHIVWSVLVSLEWNGLNCLKCSASHHVIPDGMLHGFCFYGCR